MTFFKNGEKITEEQFIDVVETNNCKYVIEGFLCINNDTLPYLIHASGVGFYNTEKRTGKFQCFKNQMSEIPFVTYERTKTEVNVLSYMKNNFDFSLWEIWKQDDPEWDTDHEEQYDSYKRWNEELYVHGIYKAFNLCEKSTMPEVSYMYNMDHNCNLSGFLIKDRKISSFQMNGGGVISFYPSYMDGNNNEIVYTGSPDEEAHVVYGCFEPECMQYFTNYLFWPDDCEEE